VGWLEDDASLRCSSLTLFETRHPFHTRHKRKRNDSNQTRGKQKSVGKGKQKVSKGEAALGKKNRAMEKGKRIMVEDDVDFNKKKHVVPRAAGIVITASSSVNVGARSKSPLNVG
ncbi:hypothetical protein Tco_0082960, partial [Tanacetum coccineum]